MCIPTFVVWLLGGVVLTALVAIVFIIILANIMGNP